MMLAKFGLTLLLATLAVGDPDGHPWQHPLPTDRRSPCPGVNALANHGYIPRNGLNISLEQFIAGVTEGLNFDPEFTTFSFNLYQNFTTTGYTNTLNLNDLEHHGELSEHDGSLSRSDLYLGDNHSFNKEIWDSVAVHFHDKTISIQDAAGARKDRFAAAKAINERFMDATFQSMGESALYLRAMRGQAKKTKTKYVQILFREERIPFNEGFKTSKVPITLGELGQIAGEIMAAS